jgi:hypothetical protein
MEDSSLDQPSPIVVMKAGLHNGERWDHIVERKLNEARVSGVAYWGYGGSVCHPLTQVQPLAAQGRPVTVLMIRTDSDFIGNPTYASQASRDGKSWGPIPDGVETSGRYALVLRSLQKVNFDLDLGAYEVAVGPKERTPLTEYLRLRVDKACARLTSVPRGSDRRQVVLRAELVAPHAVVLKTFC